MNRRMDGRQQGRRQPGRVVDHVGQVPRGTFVNHSQQALMCSHLAPSPLDHLNAYVELARHGALQGPAIRGPNIATFGPAVSPSIPLLSSGQGFYTVESLQGAASIPQGIPPPQPHFVTLDGQRIMGFGPTHLQQGYDSGMGNMHMIMNPMLGHEMLANGHPQLGSPMVAITSRPQQALFGHVFANGPIQHPLLPNMPLGFQPGRPSSGPGPLYGWPQERDHRPGWGWDRDGGRDMKGDWNHRHWDESRQVETLYAHGRKGRSRRNEQPSPPGKLVVAYGNDKKRKFPNALGPGGPGWCTLCELECSTGEMLQQHRQGKRHKRHLQKLETYPEEAKEKTNSSNSSVQVVTSEGDASSGAGKDDNGAEVLDKTNPDAVSVGQSMKTTMLLPLVGSTEELSVVSEVEQSSKPAGQGEMDVVGSKEHVDEGQAEGETMTKGAEDLKIVGDVVADGAVSCAGQVLATAQVSSAVV